MLGQVRGDPLPLVIGQNARGPPCHGRLLSPAISAAPATPGKTGFETVSMQIGSDPFSVAVHFYNQLLESLPPGPERERYHRLRNRCMRTAQLSPEERDEDGLYIRDLVIRMVEDERRNPSPKAVATGVRKILEKLEADAARGPEQPNPYTFTLGERDVGPLIYGKRKSKLRKPQYDVVKALVSAAKDGRRLTKDQLVNESGHEDARGILKRLCNDPDWAQIIEFPGMTGGGYSIRL